MDKSPEQIADILTSLGLEVEGMETQEQVAGGLKSVVVGEVLETSQCGSFATDQGACRK